MFEEIITTLDELGITYDEDYDNGTLTIDIADIDKSVLVEIINAINSYDFTIDDSSITVTGGEPMVEETPETEDALNAAAADYGMGDLGGEY